MKSRTFFNSCFGLLALLLLGGLTATFVVTVFFTQTQATNPDLPATVMTTAVPRNFPSRTPTPALSPVITAVVPEIQMIVDTVVPVSSPVATGDGIFPATEAVETVVSPPPTVSRATPSVVLTATYPVRNSGTSTYPLTVTAEVMLAQTNIAHYQNGVYATRTAVAIESAAIFGTLTANAPTPERGTP